MSIKIKQTQQVDEISDKIISSFENSPPKWRSFIKKVLPFSDH
jgi:hypothetical protein